MTTILDEAPELQALLAGIEDADPVIRRVAILQAADLATDHPALFARASHDSDVGVRLEAVRALEGIGAPEAVAALADRLDDEEEEVAAAAAESLAEILDSAAGPELVGRLVAARGRAKAAILAALRKLRQPAAQEPAIAALTDPLPEVRREAVGVLAYLRDERALPALFERVLADPAPEVRRAAIGALGFAAVETVLPALLRGLVDADWQAREEAAVTLGKLLPAGAGPGLMAALDDSHWQVRLKAAVALGGLREPQAVPALIQALGHAIPNLRREAANALGAIGDASAADALRALSGDPDIEVRKAAGRALAALGAD